MNPQPDFFADLAGALAIVTLTIAALAIMGGVVWLWGKIVSFGQGDPLPEPVTGRENGRQRLIRELQDLVQEEFDAEAPLPIIANREIADLFSIDLVRVQTIGEVKRWQRIAEEADSKLQRITRVLAMKREQHVIAVEATVPDFLRAPSPSDVA